MPFLAVSFAHADVFFNPDNVDCAGTFAPSSCSTPFATSTIGSHVQWTPSGGNSFCVVRSGANNTGLDYFYVISAGTAPTGIPRTVQSYTVIGSDTGTTISSFDVAGTTYYVNKYFTGGTGVADGICQDTTSGGNKDTLSFIYSNDNLAFTTEAQYNTWVASHSGDLSGPTRILAFSPADGETVASTSVDFSLSAYINPDDIGGIFNYTTYTVSIKLHNIDQNVLFSQLSDNDIVLYEANATSSGAFYFATTTTLSEGNYRLEATLDRRYLGGIFRNPFSRVNTSQSHQFIVGTSTFLGNISQKSFSQTQAIFNSLSATSTEALAGTCNVLSGFNVMSCIAFLLIPDGGQLNDSLTSLKDGVLVRVPWGYFTRVYNIWNTSSTSTLPSFTATVRFSPTDTDDITINPADMLVGGVSLLNSVVSPTEGVTPRDVFEPFVKLLIAIAVLYTIITDLAGTHKHDNKHLT